MLYQQLGLEERANDPLLAAVIAFAAPRQGAVTEATRLAAWCSGAAHGEGPEAERLRLAATILALALARVEPNLRTRQAVEWSLDKRWIGMNVQGHMQARLQRPVAFLNDADAAGIAEMTLGAGRDRVDCGASTGGHSID